MPCKSMHVWSHTHEAIVALAGDPNLEVRCIFLPFYEFLDETNIVPD